MAVVSRITTMVLSGVGGSRTWISTAATQDIAAGSTVVITTTMTTSGATPPVAPDTLDLSIRIDNSSTQIINFSLNTTSASQTSSFALTDTGISGGINRCGVVRMRIAAVNTTAGLSSSRYNVQSDDNTGQILPTGFTVTQRDQGWVRGTTTASVVVNNTAIGNVAFTGTYSYPDSVFFRLTLAARAYDTTKRIFLGLGNVKNIGVDDSDGDRNYDASFINGINSDFTLTSTSRVCTVVVVDSSSLVGNDFVSFTVATQTITVDPRLTFLNVTRTSPLAVVNYGIHTVTATFNVKNSRNENMNATTHGSAATLTVKSLDLTSSLAEKTISTTASPSTELYSISYLYNGPTSVVNRGIGPQGDTATHTIAGKSKGLRAFPTSNSANVFDSSSTLVSLSDLYRLDAHPQKTNVVVVEPDPYLTVSPEESQFYTIALDELFGFTYIGDVNGVAVSGVAAKMALYDPLGNQTIEGEQSSNTGANGYSALGYKFTVVSPVGTWRYRVRVDIDSFGSQGNYGDALTTSGSTLVGSLFQDIEFVPPYTANRTLVIQAPNEAELGVVSTITVEYLNNIGTRLTFDSAPKIRIYKIDNTGAQVVDLTLTASTKIGSTDSYTTNWTPSSNGIYNIEVRADKDQSGLAANKQIEIRPRSVFDPTGLFK